MCISLVKLHLNEPQVFWNNVIWTEKTKVELCGHNAQQFGENQTRDHKRLVTKVEYHGRGVMISIIVELRYRKRPEYSFTTLTDVYDKTLSELYKSKILGNLYELKVKCKKM